MTAKKLKTALILGSTGLVGSYCLQELLKSDEYSKVISLVRRETSLKDSKLVTLLTDFTNLEETLVDVRVDDIYCCLGTTMKKAGSKKAFRAVDYEIPIKVAKILRDRGSCHFLVVSALGANPSSIFFYNRTKGELEDALERLSFPFLTILRPSLLLGKRADNRPMESLGIKFAEITKPLYIGPLKVLAAVESSQVAKEMVRQAKQVLSGERLEPNLVIDSQDLH